jgi:hypothetical protein
MKPIKNHVPILFLISLILLVPLLSLFSGPYPDLDKASGSSLPSNGMLDLAQVESFLSLWQDDFEQNSITLGTFSRELAKRLSEQNITLQQLRSVYQIQSYQVANLKDQAKPVFALFSDASNPLYSYSLSTTAFTFGTTTYETTTQSHRMGIGASVTQRLPSAGTVSLTVKEGSTYSLSDSDTDWTWKHSPSVGVSFQQPLALGKGLVDTTYSSKQLERKELEQLGAKETVEATLEALVLQGSQLLALRQNLLESRWVLVRQEQLVEEELSDTFSDFAEGRVSKNDLERKNYARDQLLVQISSLDSQIASVTSSLESLYGTAFSAVPMRIAISYENLERLLSYGGNSLVTDTALFEQVLRFDDSYQNALREKRIAQIDASFSNPADRPVFSVGLQLSPYYDATEGNGFLGSVGELFDSGKPVFSVSVNFSASDLSLKTSALTKELAGESLTQAIWKVRDALDSVTLDLEDFQRRLNDQLLTLRLALSDYQIKANDVEVELIRASMGLGSESSIQIRENLNYASAFAVLQSLRELEILTLELDAKLGNRN